MSDFSICHRSLRSSLKARLRTIFTTARQSSLANLNASKSSKDLILFIEHNNKMLYILLIGKYKVQQHSTRNEKPETRNQKRPALTAPRR